jgi:two-component system, chemotaxis family, chemotaxis protein CheY
MANKSILLVDDSSVLRQNLSTSLRGAGFQVTEAVDGNDALEKIKMQSFHLVIADQNMPRMDGLTLTRSLRGIANYQSVPVLLLMENAAEATKVNASAKAAGVNGWLVKPIDSAQLLAISKKILA